MALLFGTAVPPGCLAFLDALTGPGAFFSFDFNIRATLALILVSLNCGMVGSVVVGSRMAFFTDALAHSAVAGICFGFLIFTGLVEHVFPRSDFWEWVTPVMVCFGVLVGFGIAAVRERTGLTTDTVIGIFFAGAIGLAGALRILIKSRKLFILEDFLFGDPLGVQRVDLLYLALLTLLSIPILLWIHNDLLLASFNTSLALSRRIPVQRVNYLFVVLLALIVNVCLRSVGALLINALMVVPAATASLLCRNLRQMFWVTISITFLTSLGGLAINWEFTARTGVEVGIPGTIILLNVVLFVASMELGRWGRGSQTVRPIEPLPRVPA